MQGFDVVVKEHMEGTEGWIPFEVDEGKAPDVNGWKKAIPGSSVEMIKAECLLKGVNAEAIWNRVFTQTFEEKHKADAALLCEETIEQFGENSKVMYQAYHAPWYACDFVCLVFIRVCLCASYIVTLMFRSRPVSTRDMVFRRTRLVKDGVYYQVDISESNAKKPDPLNGYVRAMLMASYRYTPVAEGTLCTYVVHMDPKGILSNCTLCL